MSEEKKVKNPFGNLDQKAIIEAEATMFVIMIGKEFFQTKKGYLFSKVGADHHYANVYNGFLDMLESGNADDYALAVESFLNFRVLPFRLQ